MINLVPAINAAFLIIALVALGVAILAVHVSNFIKASRAAEKDALEREARSFRVLQDAMDTEVGREVGCFLS
jgi:hypothetical protein